MRMQQTRMAEPVHIIAQCITDTLGGGLIVCRYSRRGGERVEVWEFLSVEVWSVVM